MIRGLSKNLIRSGVGRPNHPNARLPSCLMLPLAGTGSADNDFTEFYKGMLLGLEDLKLRGVSARVTLYDTERSPEKVYSIVSSPSFWSTSLVIGPVYENELAALLPLAEQLQIPVVSPLATLRSLDSPVLYQMSPDPASRYDKLRSVFGISSRGGYSRDSDAFGGTNSLTDNDFWSRWRRANSAPMAGEGSVEPNSETGSATGSATRSQKNIILLSSGPMGDDEDFEREITTLLGGQNFGRFTLTGTRSQPRRGTGGPPTESEELAGLIDWGRENVFVVLGGSEMAVDRALTTISTSYNNASARGSRRARIRVVGSSRWASWSNLDKNLFFRLGATFVTSYYISRLDERSAGFERRYLTAYGSVPSRASYRGYDAVRIFVQPLAEPSYIPFSDRVGDVTLTPLRVPYRFVRPVGLSRHVNAEWALVEFNSDFNIIIK